MQKIGALIAGVATVLAIVAIDKAFGITTKALSVVKVTPK